MSRIFGDWNSGSGRGGAVTQSNGGGITIEFTNHYQVDELLKKLPAEYQPKFILGMLKHAVVPMADEARRLAPISTAPHAFTFSFGRRFIQPGTLAESLGIMVMRRAKKTTIIFGPQVKNQYKYEKGGFYGHWVEFGHKNRCGKITPPHPFMRPAWDSQKANVIKRFETDVQKRFDKYFKRLWKQGKMT